MRYIEIPGWEDIIGGFSGGTDSAEDAVDFLQTWSHWLVQLITYIKEFIEGLGKLMK